MKSQNERAEIVNSRTGPNQHRDICKHAGSTGRSAELYTQQPYCANDMMIEISSKIDMYCLQTWLDLSEYLSKVMAA